MAHFRTFISIRRTWTRRSGGLLALCLTERKLFKEATEEARQAIVLEPDLPFAHYAHAHVLADRNRPEEALQAVSEAVRLDPYDADFCALEAQCQHNLKQWSKCLAAAERGLEVKPIPPVDPGPDAQHILQLGFAAVDTKELKRGVRVLGTILRAAGK